MRQKYTFKECAYVQERLVNFTVSSCQEEKRLSNTKE